MTTRAPLDITVSVPLNGTGGGVASVGPLSAREVWNPANVHVSVATNILEAQCGIYVGDSALQRNFRDITLTGSTGDSSDRVNADVVKCGSKVWAVWTGGDPKANATLSITGTRAIT